MIINLFAFSDLVRCQYYVTSEKNFNHYIPYANATNLNSSHLMSLRFYSLAEHTIKVKLAASNDSTPIDSPENLDSNPYPMEATTDRENNYNNGYEYDNNNNYNNYGTRLRPITTTTRKPISYTARGLTESHKHDVGYEIGK